MSDFNRVENWKTGKGSIEEIEGWIIPNKPAYRDDTRLTDADKIYFKGRANFEDSVKIIEIGGGSDVTGFATFKLTFRAYEPMGYIVVQSRATGGLQKDATFGEAKAKAAAGVERPVPLDDEFQARRYNFATINALFLT